MSEDNAPADANSATEPEPKPLTVEEALAHARAGLAGAMERSSRFLDILEDMADAPSQIAFPAIQAAAQILRVQTASAETLARVARGETCHRSIVERVEHSNSESDEPPRLTDDEMRERILGRLKRMMPDPPPEEAGDGTSG